VIARSAGGRAGAVDKPVRVLKPGGCLILVEFRSTTEYRERLQQLGMRKVVLRRVVWRFWYGGPWGASKLGKRSAPP
jgi:arsenite methyltransferase